MAPIGEDMDIDLHDIRQEYSKKSLEIEDCKANPFEQFKEWLDEAMHSQVNEPTAMNVATVDAEGRPSARVVLLKEVTDEGFIFFTNYQSRKGRSIADNKNVALTFFWPELERCVRIEGEAEFLAPEASDAYFASRPHTSQIGAWASEQSQPLSSKAALLGKVALIAAKHPIKVPRPPHWGGYIVKPRHIEFWQGRPSRLHDRIAYDIDGETREWGKVRLNP